MTQSFLHSFQLLKDFATRCYAHKFALVYHIKDANSVGECLIDGKWPAPFRHVLRNELFTFEYGLRGHDNNRNVYLLAHRQPSQQTPILLPQNILGLLDFAQNARKCVTIYE